MLILAFLLILVTSIALFVKKNDAIKYNNYNFYIGQSCNNNIYSFIKLFIIIFILTTFAGLRTGYNDTINYVHYFQNRIPESLSDIINLNLSLGTTPGFHIYQIIIKSTFGENPQLLIFISSLIYITVLVLFYYKYSYKFSLSIFLFLTSGLFVFGMAAVKQVLAMSIGVYAFRYLINKKWTRYIFAIFLAATIHIYILLYLFIPLFTKSIWSKKIVFMIFVTTIGVVYFEVFISTLLGFTELFGKVYRVQSFLQTDGINIFRILVLFVTPLLSWIYRKRIRCHNDELLNLCVNASIISLLLIIPGYFGGANMFGRLSYYFQPFSVLALIWILYNAVNYKNRKLIIFLCIIFYFFFFLYQSRGFSNDFQHMIQIF